MLYDFMALNDVDNPTHKVHEYIMRDDCFF